MPLVDRVEIRRYLIHISTTSNAGGAGDRHGRLHSPVRRTKARGERQARAIVSARNDSIELEILGMNLHGRSVRAEQRYGSAAVRIHNVGTHTFGYKDQIYVHLAVGKRRDAPADADYVWRERLSRDLKPNSKHDVRFPDFVAPTGSQAWPLVAWVTCGTDNPRATPEDEWKGGLRTAARYDVKLLAPRERYLEPLDTYRLTAGFENGPEFKLPAGQPWWIRSRVKRHPAGADPSAFELDAKLNRWGDDEVAERARDGFTKNIVVPPAPGNWIVELTLMRGRAPFEPCAHTPGLWAFQVKEWDVCDELEPVIEGVTLVGKTVDTESQVPSFDVRVRNRGRFAWQPDDEIHVVIGNGRRWGDFSDHQGSKIYAYRLDDLVEPGERTQITIRDFQSPKNENDARERKRFIAYVTCGGPREANVKAEWPGDYTALAGWGVQLSQYGDTTLNPGQKGRWSLGVTHASYTTWPGGKPWRLVTKVLGGSIPQAVVDAFEVDQPLGDDEVGSNRDLPTVQHSFVVPEDQGDYRLRMTLLRAGEAFEAAGNPHEFSFKIYKPEYAVKLTWSPYFNDFKYGDTEVLKVTVENVGSGTFPAREWRLELHPEYMGGHKEAATASGPALAPGGQEQVPLTFKLPASWDSFTNTRTVHDFTVRFIWKNVTRAEIEESIDVRRD